jgi:hypothetical protein
VANDGIFSTILLYETGQLTKKSAIEMFNVSSVYNQYFFCTEKALSALAFVESYGLELK